MRVDDANRFGTGYMGIDIVAFLDAIAAIDDDDAVAALRPCPLAFAAQHARRPSGISVARTFYVVDPRSTTLVCPFGHFLITIALSDADLSISSDDVPLLDGRMVAGSVCVTGAGGRLAINSRGACDLMHLAIPAAQLGWSTGRRFALDGLVLHDALIRRIGRLLAEAPPTWLRAYAELLSQLALTRLLQLAPQTPIRCLPAWRLKKVQAYIEANIAEPLRLDDLATAAGLSRMHFAAQFRAATGLRPHNYVLSRRVEHAKRAIADEETALVEVALDAGFQSQAHFCTIFKRLTGVTPSAWRRQLHFTRDIGRGKQASTRTVNLKPAAAFLQSCFVVRTERIRTAPRPS